MDPKTDPVRPAYVDRISVVLGIDHQLVQLQLEAGTADLSFVEQVPVSELASLLKIGDTNLTLAPPGKDFGAIHYLTVNTVDPNYNAALQKLAVRQALAYAVDKAAIVQDWAARASPDPHDRPVPRSTSGLRRVAIITLLPVIVAILRNHGSFWQMARVSRWPVAEARICHRFTGPAGRAGHSSEFQTGWYSNRPGSLYCRRFLFPADA